MAASSQPAIQVSLNKVGVGLHEGANTLLAE